VLLTAPADAIEAALDIVEQSGGARSWLAQHGLSDAELEQLRARLLSD
jgi:hypothetical protein